MLVSDPRWPQDSDPPDHGPPSSQPGQGDGGSVPEDSATAPLPDPSLDGTSAIWVRAIQDGKQADTAMLHLEQRYLMRLRLYVAARLGPALRQKCDPDEIINDAWWRAVRSIHRFEYRQAGSFLGWLRKQVDYVVLDRCRELKTEPPIVSLASDSQTGSVIRDPADHKRGPTTEVGLRDMRTRLVESLESVPSIYRRVLERAFLQDQDRTEIAQELNLKANTVSQQIKRGLEHWRRVLGDDPLTYI